MAFGPLVISFLLFIETASAVSLIASSNPVVTWTFVANPALVLIRFKFDWMGKTGIFKAL